MKYPITMISNRDGAIVEFTSEHSGTYIKVGIDSRDFENFYGIGTTRNNFISCEDTEQWSVYKTPDNEVVTIEQQWDIVSEYVEHKSKDTSTSNEVRGNGGNTSYYNVPENAKVLGDLIKHKKMEHGIGEAFCALYRLNDNSEYKRNLTKAKYYIEQELKWLKKCHQE